MIYAEGCRVELDGNMLDVIVEFQCICATMADAGYPIEHIHECVDNGFEACAEKHDETKKQAHNLIKKVAKNAQKNKGVADSSKGKTDCI